MRGPFSSHPLLCISIDPSNITDATTLDQSCGGWYDPNTGTNRGAVRWNDIDTEIGSKAKGYICPPGQRCVSAASSVTVGETFDNVLGSSMQVIVIASANTWSGVMVRWVFFLLTGKEGAHLELLFFCIRSTKSWRRITGYLVSTSSLGKQEEYCFSAFLYFANFFCFSVSLSSTCGSRSCLSPSSPMPLQTYERRPNKVRLEQPSKFYNICLSRAFSLSFFFLARTHLKSKIGARTRPEEKKQSTRF